MRVWNAAAAVCLFALACSVLGRHAQQVRERMVGLPAHSVRDCLGVPGYFDLEDGTELWVFAVPLPSQTQEIHIEVAQGPGTAWQPPRVTKGSPQRGTRSDTREAVLDDAIPPGQCRLAFELREGVVSRFEGFGISADGLNADARCTILAERCLDDAPSDDAEGR